MEGLVASKRVTEAARRESHFLEKQLEELERKLQSSQQETRTADEKLQMFLKKVAALLQRTSEDVVRATERDVLQAVDNICNKVRDAYILDYSRAASHNQLDLQKPACLADCLQPPAEMLVFSFPFVM